MFLCCTHSQFDPAKADEVAALSSELKASLGKLPGIQHAHVAFDRAAERAIAITLFDTREHAQFACEAVGTSSRGCKRPGRRRVRYTD